MSSIGLEKLISEGALKISSKTHISQNHIRAILDESFDGFSKIQFLGFISILEREYNVDLQELKDKGIAYFDVEKNDDVKNTIFLEPERDKSKTPLYLSLAFVIVVISAIIYGVSSSENEKKLDINNKTIEKATKQSSNALVDNEEIIENVSASEVVDKDVNITNKPEVETIALEETPVVNPEGVEESKLIIIPKTKVWMGYIDVKTNKHHTKSFKNEFALDTTKDWLLLFGHGYVSININGKVTKFSSKKRLRILYKDNEIKQITKAQFKELNKGREW